MKYLFVLGRNPELSAAEILSYFEREDIPVKDYFTRSNGLLIEVDRSLDVSKTINELGGTIAIGRVLISGNKEKLIKELEEKPIYFGKENKVIYSVMDFADENTLNDVLSAVKRNFAAERLKARYKGVSGRIKLQGGAVVAGSPEKMRLRDMTYFVFEGKESAFGVIESSHSSEESEKRDIGKPVRRESLAISPRLAKILINLSQVKKKQTLLDPFCGIGVILTEALLKEINVIGIDIDREAIESAKKNIEWLRGNYEIKAQAKLVNYDSRKYKLEKADGIATEPSLSELMTKVPSRERAAEIANEFEKMMIDVLNNFEGTLEGGSKIAFSAPLIKSTKGKVSCNIENILERTGLSLCRLKYSKGVGFPIREFREGQIVGREFFVLTF